MKKSDILSILAPLALVIFLVLTAILMRLGYVGDGFELSLGASFPANVNLSVEAWLDSEAVGFKCKIGSNETMRIRPRKMNRDFEHSIKNARLLYGDDFWLDPNLLWHSVEDGVELSVRKSENTLILSVNSGSKCHEISIERDVKIAQATLTEGLTVFRLSSPELWYGGKTEYIAIDIETGTTVISGQTLINSDPFCTHAFSRDMLTFDAWYDGEKLWILDNTYYTLAPHSGVISQRDVISWLNSHGGTLASHMVTLVSIDVDEINIETHPFSTDLTADYRIYLRIGFED